MKKEIGTADVADIFFLTSLCEIDKSMEWGEGCEFFPDAIAWIEFFLSSTSESITTLTVCRNDCAKQRFQMKITIIIDLSM